MPVAAPAPNTGPVPAKSGGGLKVVLIIVAIVAGIGAIAVGIVGYGVYRVVHTVKQAVVTDDKGNVTLNSPTGGISLGKNIIATEDELGLPIFPGATRGPGGMRVKNKTGSMITVVYRTDSDIDAVVAFYKSRMPDADETANDRNHATVLKSGPDSDQTMVVISPDTGSDKLLTSIMITRIKQVGK